MKLERILKSSLFVYYIEHKMCTSFARKFTHRAKERADPLVIFRHIRCTSIYKCCIHIVYVSMCRWHDVYALDIAFDTHIPPFQLNGLSIRSVRLEISFRTAFYAKIISICSGAMVVVRNIRCSIPYLTYVIRTTSFNECNKKKQIFANMCVVHI